MRLPLLCCGALVAANSYAEPASQVLAYNSNVGEEVVVTATRSAQAVKDTLVSTTLVTRADIERSQARDLNQLLRTIPGVNIRRNGGRGSATAISLRGGDSSGTLVLIDGIKAGSATLGQVSLEQLSVDQIERIEIIRGPKSSLYGGSAMNGVVQIFTRKAREQDTVEYTLSLADDHTKEGIISASAVGETHSFIITASHVAADGFDARYDDDEVSGLPQYDQDSDGYRQSHLAFNLDQTINEYLSANVLLNRGEGETEYDNLENPAWVTDAGETLPYSTFETTTYVAGIKLKYKNYSGKLSYSVYEDLSEQKNDAPNRLNDTFIETYRSVGQWENSFEIGSLMTFNFGADYQQEVVDSTSGYTTDERENFAGYSALLLDLGMLSLSGGLRHDENSQFGGKWTGDAAVGLEVSEGVTLSLNYGTAFKAPSFNDLYWPATAFSAGNPSLAPELTETYEVGFDVYQDWGFTSLHVYKSFVDNLIEWASADGFFWQPSNVSSTKLNGVEFQYGATLMGTEVAVGLAYERAIDEASGEDLRRRPRRTASLSLDRSFGPISAGATFYAQGQHYDSVLGVREVIPGYGQLDLRAAWQVNDSVRLRAKMDNLFNKNIVETHGYNTEGRFLMLAVDVVTH